MSEITLRAGWRPLSEATEMMIEGAFPSSWAITLDGKTLEIGSVVDPWCWEPPHEHFYLLACPVFPPRTGAVLREEAR